MSVLNRILRTVGAALLAAALPGTPSATAAEDSLVIDLSDRVVAITTGFTGSNLLLFGAVEQEGDIVVVVRGPREDTVVRRKERVAGIWVNRAELAFADVPAFYAMASTGPVSEVVSDMVRREYELGVDRLRLTPVDSSVDSETVRNFGQALRRANIRRGVFRPDVERVTFVGGRLFRTDIHLPSNVTVGRYAVNVYLFSDGQLVDLKTTELNVRKSGAEARVYNFAHDYGLAYGVLAVVIAVVAGWLANLAFRRA